ncbi:hypothetical protein EON65_05730 [archaeon]|nr:MAG: hypothetical protein EON65_05730 [archaeon]
MSSNLDIDDDWSHGSQKLLDQMLQSRVYMFLFNIPLKVRHQIKFSLRTAWSVFLTIMLMKWWEWSPIALYLSPVITIIASSMYFGLWQENFFNMSYGVIIGTAIGVLIGLAYKITPLHIVLIFVALTWINRMPQWDRLTQILSSLSMMLGAVWPFLTDGSVMGLNSFAIVLSINFIPYLITGFSLLFPRLALATYHARFQALLVCRKLSSMTVAIYDDVDICLAEFDQHHSEVVADLAALKSLARHVDYERIVFRSVQHLPASLMVFIEISELIVQELLGIRDMMKKISFNTTHSKFASHLKPFLVDLAVEMEISLSMVGEHFDSFDPLRGLIPASLRQYVSDLCKCRLFAEQSHATRQRMSRFYDIPKSSELLHSYNQYKSNKSARVHHHPVAASNMDKTSIR